MFVVLFVSGWMFYVIVVFEYVNELGVVFVIVICNFGLFMMDCV